MHACVCAKSYSGISSTSTVLSIPFPPQHTLQSEEKGREEREREEGRKREKRQIEKREEERYVRKRGFGKASC